MFVVVCFFGTSEVDVAPNAWIVATESGDVCCWPPYKTTQRLVKAKISCESPTSQWERYAVKIMYGPAASYERAVEKMKNAMYTSDLATDVSDKELQKSRNLSSSEGSSVEPSDNEAKKTKPCSTNKIQGRKQMKRSAAKFPPLPVLPKPPPLHAASSQTLDAVVCNQSVTSPAPASASHADLAEFVSMPLESPPVPVVSQPPEVASKHNLHDLPVAQPPDRSRNSQNPQAIAQEGTSMPFASNTPIVPSGSATVAEITTPSTHVRPGVLVPQSCSALSPRRNEMVIATNRRIFTALEQLKLQNEELKSQMHSQSALLQLLVGRYGGVEDAVSQLPDWLSLPCNSVQELQQLEGQLSDGAMRSNVVRFLAAAGGSTVAETVRRVMRKTMATAVAVQLNWLGTRGKIGLSKMDLKNVIFESVRRNPASNRASDAEMEQVVSKWLRFAGDRSGGRQRRAVQAESRARS